MPSEEKKRIDHGERALSFANQEPFKYAPGNTRCLSYCHWTRTRPLVLCEDGVADSYLWLAIFTLFARLAICSSQQQQQTQAQ
eukprot:1825489-Pleurochrysis_carterae.AAC.14